MLSKLERGVIVLEDPLLIAMSDEPNVPERFSVPTPSHEFASVSSQAHKARAIALVGLG
jgi:hypothetical protein